MKSVAFLRNAWRRKDKDKKNASQGKQDTSTTKQIVLVPESAPCTPTKMTLDIPVTRVSPPLPDHRARSFSQETLLYPAPALTWKASGLVHSSSSSLIDVESIASSSTAFSDRYELGYPGSPVIRKFSHGPPMNAFHGPPNLNLYSPVLGTSPKSAGGVSPIRPPRPPPLNLNYTTTKRPVNTGLSPRAASRVTFALPPNPRVTNPSPSPINRKLASGKDSPGFLEDHDETASQSSQETARCACSLIFPDGNHVQPHRIASNDTHAANHSLPRRNDSLPLLSSSPRIVHAADTSSPQRVYQSGLHTSSTPHLPSRDNYEVPPVPPLPSADSGRHADDTSNFPLSLFPDPPPLFIRRKISKNLLLRPSTANTHLTPSSGLSSPTYTPLASPTTRRPHTAPGNSKPYLPLSRHPFTRTIPPPLFDPPTSPLPTPPTSPSAKRPSPSPLSRSLRVVKSSNQLRREPLAPTVLATHRTTSSEPTSLCDGVPGMRETRRRVQSRPVGHLDTPFEGQLVMSDGQMQQGYAF